MRYIYIFTLLILLPFTPTYSTTYTSIEDRLRYLDTVLDSTQVYTEAKELRIKELRSKISENSHANTEERLLLNTLLYSEYSKYDSDNAFELIVESIKLSEQADRLEDYLLWSLRKAQLYSASGLLTESKEVLDSIRGKISKRTTLLEYYIQMEYLFSHFEQYTTSEIKHTPAYDKRKSSYIDSISLIAQPSDKYYLINQGWKNMESDSSLYFLKELEKSYKNIHKGDKEYALEAYAIARIYNANDDRDKYTEYLINSAIYDIRSCNHDIASLQELSTIIIEDGDNIERAYRYISYCLDKAEKFGDRVRTTEIAKILNTTYQQLLLRNRTQSRRLAIYLGIMILLMAIVIMLIVRVSRHVTKLKIANQNINKAKEEIELHNIKLEQTQHKLSSVNEEIQIVNSELSTVNEKLIENNFIKEKYIGKSFEVCASHIGNMEKICSKISTLVRGAKYDELKSLCDSSFTLNKQLKELYQTFDDTFLSIYPDFVEKFNSLLLPDKQIKLREGEMLNTELRIYALIRLGITDNQKIATILHCSLQTIYNYYQKTKNRTELHSKEFIAKIMGI